VTVDRGPLHLRARGGFRSFEALVQETPQGWHLSVQGVPQDRVFLTREAAMEHVEAALSEWISTALVLEASIFVLLLALLVIPFSWLLLWL
jgi:hypothetical protein